MSYQDNNSDSQPHFPAGERIGKAQAEAYWWLFQSLPVRRNRLQQAQAAFQRLHKRRRQSVLPPRAAFNTTIDYYEALVPLYVAQSRFNTLIEQSELSLRLLRRVSAYLIPKHLF